MANRPTLIFMCGKMAAGKSTLARELAAREQAVLLVQDEWLEMLYPREIVTFDDFIERSAHLRAALAPHVCTLLARGLTVVLDFPANTVPQRAWFRELFERADVPHELHLVEVDDATCKRQLQARSKHLPPGTAWTTEAEFDLVTAHFRPPTEAEGFNVITHTRRGHL